MTQQIEPSIQNLENLLAETQAAKAKAWTELVNLPFRPDLLSPLTAILKAYKANKNKAANLQIVLDTCNALEPIILAKLKESKAGEIKANEAERRADYLTKREGTLARLSGATDTLERAFVLSDLVAVARQGR